MTELPPGDWHNLPTSCTVGPEMRLMGFGHGLRCTSSQCKLSISGHGIALIQDDQLEFVAARRYIDLSLMVPDCFSNFWIRSSEAALA